MTTKEQLEYIWLVDSLVLSETGKHLDSLTRKIIEGTPKASRKKSFRATSVKAN